MVSSWQVIESGRLSPDAIMAKDAHLLRQLTFDSPPFLHLYEWEVPCLTYGYFTDPSCFLNIEAMEEWGLKKARRPTGGGIIFHISDLAFSVLIPSSHPFFSLNSLDNYAFINQKVAEVVAHWTTFHHQPRLLSLELSCSNRTCQAFCMAKPTQYDLMIEGKNVGGAAQRRTRDGFLHQATLSLLFPPVDLLCQVLKNHAQVIEAMQRHSFCLLPEQATQHDLQESRIQIRELLKQMIVTL
jgi:lipoate-protein ligase A